MKNALDLLVELYAIKLAKAALLWDVRTMSRTTDNYPKINISNLDKHEFHAEAKSFIKPVFMALKKPELKLTSPYQRQLLKILQNARATNIIDENYNILAPKQFTNLVLKKCVLPAYVSCMHDSMLDTEWLFYSLTGVNFASIIQEQTKSVLDHPAYALDIPPYKNGVVSDPDRLNSAIYKCRYQMFVEMDEINATVGTDGMDLFRTMVSRMFERVTQPQKA